MLERERVLLQADKQMADINRRDSILRGRGYSMRLAQEPHFVEAKINHSHNEELLLDGADEDLLLKDFDDHEVGIPQLLNDIEISKLDELEDEEINLADEHDDDFFNQG